MTGQERMIQWYHGGETACCGACRHYVEHYVLSAGTRWLIKISDGHCVKRRCKRCRAWDTCEGYEPREQRKGE